MIVLKIDAKFEGKLTSAFKNDMRNLADFHRLKNSDFVLEIKMRNKIKIKLQNNQIDQIDFILPWK